MQNFQTTMIEFMSALMTFDCQICGSVLTTQTGLCSSCNRKIFENENIFNLKSRFTVLKIKDSEYRSYHLLNWSESEIINFKDWVVYLKGIQSQNAWKFLAKAYYYKFLEN